jgi:hypothetical protein
LNKRLRAAPQKERHHKHRIIFGKPMMSSINWILAERIQRVARDLYSDSAFRFKEQG